MDCCTKSFSPVLTTLTWKPTILITDWSFPEILPQCTSVRCTALSCNECAAPNCTALYCIVLHTTVLGPHSYHWGLCYQQGLPCLVFHLCRVGVTFISFSSIHLLKTRPALYKNKPACMFEMNKIIFRPHLDMSRGVFGLPGKNKN